MRTFNTFSALRAIDEALASGVAELPVAAQPVPSAETVAAIVADDNAKRDAKRAKQRAAREAKPVANAKPSSKRGKPAPVKASSVTETGPDAASARAERIAGNRNTVRALYSTFETNRLSVPVKPLSAFKPVPTVAHPITRNPSERQAAAIALAFTAAGKQLKPNASVPRVFEIDGVPSCVENGVLRDAVSSGLCSVAGADALSERITVSGKAVTSIIGLLGSRVIKAGKLA